MRNRYSKLSAAMLIVSASALAEVETGTGAPLQLTLADDQRTVVQVDYEGVTLIGSTKLQEGYGVMALDALYQNELQPNWGRAEVLAGCGSADIVVYKNHQGSEIELIATQVEIDRCE